MTINKFIKYTSLLVLGTWMLSAPGNAFAANEKVEKEVADFSKVKMSDGTAFAKGQSIKKSAEEYKAFRDEIKTKFEAKDKEYTDLRSTLRNKCRGAYKERLKKVAEQADEETRETINTMAQNWDEAEGFWESAWAVIKSGAQWSANAIKQQWKIAKTVVGLDVILDKLSDTMGQFLLETFTPGFSYVYNAEAIINGCTFGERVTGDDYEKLRTIAAEAEELANELDALPENIGDANVYVYLAYAGKDKNGVDQYVEHYYLMYSDGTMKSIAGVTRGCTPLPAKLAESRSCIYCPLFKTIFNAAQSMSSKAYASLAEPLANVMLMGFAIVIAFMVLKNVSSFTKQDAPKFVTELLVNMFKVLIAYYMLKNADIVYSYIVGPVLKAGFEFGSNLLFASDKSYLSSCKVTTTGVQMGVMPSYLYTNLDCFIKAVQAEVAVPQSVGSSLMCVARNAGKESVGPVRNVLWDFGMMFQGLAIWIMGWIISLAFAFYLIDATIQLGIIGALMPFLIACWPFKATRNYTSKGWGIFMNTFFVYVFMGLVVSINVELLGQGLTASEGGFDEVMKALNGNDVKRLKDLLDIGFAGFLVLVACCLFAFKLTGQASSLAGTMAGGGGPSIGANIGGLAANVATRGVQGTAKFGLKTAKAVSDKTGITSVANKGKDWLKDKGLGAIGLGRRSGAAGNKQARHSQMAAQQQGGADGQTPQTQTRSATSGTPNPTAQNQIKKMQQAGPRPQQPATSSPQTPTNSSTPQGGAAQGGTPHGNQANAQQAQTPQQTPEQMRQQLESDYNNTANGRAGRQMIQNQTAEVARNKKAENEAQGKMNYHNRRADDYLKKAQSASDPAQKKNFENLANAQFEEAVKAEAAYNKAKADTQKAQSELDAIKQENERYKNQYVQDEMKKRNPKK